MGEDCVPKSHESRSLRWWILRTSSILSTCDEGAGWGSILRIGSGGECDGVPESLMSDESP